MKNTVEPFKSVTFRREYPTREVAEHEVCMSFSDDETAIAFRDWWNVVGAEDFARWLQRTGEQHKRGDS